MVEFVRARIEGIWISEGLLCLTITELDGFLVCTWLKLWGTVFSECSFILEVFLVCVYIVYCDMQRRSGAILFTVTSSLIVFESHG